MVAAELKTSLKEDHEGLEESKNGIVVVVVVAAAVTVTVAVKVALILPSWIVNTFTLRHLGHCHGLQNLNVIFQSQRR